MRNLISRAVIAAAVVWGAGAAWANAAYPIRFSCASGASCTATIQAPANAAMSSISCEWLLASTSRFDFAVIPASERMPSDKTFVIPTAEERAAKAFTRTSWGSLIEVDDSGFGSPSIRLSVTSTKPGKNAGTCYLR